MLRVFHHFFAGSLAAFTGDDPSTAPEPPVLIWVSGTGDLTPEFSLVLDSNAEEDDILRFYDETDGLLHSHTVTALEADDNLIDLDLPELTPGDYDIYVTHERDGAESDPSNTESKTLSAANGWDVNWWWR